MKKIYNKRDSILYEAIDEELVNLCNEFLKYDEELELMISTKFEMTENGLNIKKEIERKKVIFASKKICDLKGPSKYKISSDGIISTWICDKPVAYIYYVDKNIKDNILCIDSDLIEKKKIGGVYKCKIRI